jgi:glycosyltransferase involved in cell wall biosynthesis
LDVAEPLVSVVTPVHNGEKFLTECIESVIGQRYQNWEYIIVNNASTDRTGEIAGKYANQDSRIRVCSTDNLLPIMQNWNHSLRQISHQSKYCKVVHADDWLFPDCLAEMVAIAEQNPRVGLVGAYGLENSKVVCGNGLPYPSSVMRGHEVCRLTLLKQTYPFLRPTCLLIRSDLIQNRNPFYNEHIIHADVEVCYELLKNCDFGFVHQVLTFIRWHEDSVTLSFEKPWNKSILWNIDLLLKFGKDYLDRGEYNDQLNSYLADYYKFLAKAKRKGMEPAFWDYHKNSLDKLGLNFSNWKLRAARMLNFIGIVSNYLYTRVHWISPP